MQDDLSCWAGKFVVKFTVNLLHSAAVERGFELGLKAKSLIVPTSKLPVQLQDGPDVVDFGVESPLGSKILNHLCRSSW